MRAVLVIQITGFLLPAPVTFWGQVVIVVIGRAWCIVLVCTLVFGDWYAWTHPTTGNDRVMCKLARLLRFLTLGLTDSPFPETDARKDTYQEAQAEQETQHRSRCGRAEPQGHCVLERNRPNVETGRD